jgi:hypothetical protein
MRSIILNNFLLPYTSAFLLSISAFILFVLSVQVDIEWRGVYAAGPHSVAYVT